MTEPDRWRVGSAQILPAQTFRLDHWAGQAGRIIGYPTCYEWMEWAGHQGKTNIFVLFDIFVFVQGQTVGAPVNSPTWALGTTP